MRQTNGLSKTIPQHTIKALRDFFLQHLNRSTGKLIYASTIQKKITRQKIKVNTGKKLTISCFMLVNFVKEI